jgi:hypothetical protein
MTKFVNWLVKSSEDPNKVSMTIKGVLMLQIPTIIFLGQFLGYHWTNTNVAELIQTISLFVGTGLAFIGLGRKLLNSFTK